MKTQNHVLTNKLKACGNKLKVKYASLTFPQQITIVWGIVMLISLFLPRIIDSQEHTPVVWSGFSTLSGNIGYFITPLTFILFFLTISEWYKEKLKLYSAVHINHHSYALFVWFIGIMSGSIGISIASGLDYVSQYITYGTGSILIIVWWIVTMVWGFLLIKEDAKTSSDIILERLSKNREKNKEKDNMKLPI